jgi:hypothetical protein
MRVETVILAVVVGSLAAVKSVLRCVEILIQAQADNMRERTRRRTILAIMAAMQPRGATILLTGQPENWAAGPGDNGQ